MKTTITIILTLIIVQVRGQQIIDSSQQDSLFTVRQDTTFTKADEKLFNGIVKTTTEDEVKFSHYENGCLFVDSSFYSTQKLKAVFRYKNKKTTDRFLFDQYGNKFQEDIYLDSNKTLKQSIWWHPNGQLWRIEMYYNGMKTGKWYEWFKNGNLLFEGEFKQGNKFGVWTYYNANTKKIIRQEQH